MTNRKENSVDEFIKLIDKSWQLSIEESDVLESVFLAFCGRKTTEIKKIEHLLNDETEKLLELLNERDIIRYAENELDLISDQDEDSLVDALDDLNFKWINKVDIDDMIFEIEESGYSIEERGDNVDIVTQSDLEEMTELFLNLSPQKRSEIINNLK